MTLNLVPTTVFAKILYKINFINEKDNQFLVGIDILKENERKALLALSTLCLEEAYIKIVSHPNPSQYLKSDGKVLFLNCIQKICEDFFTKKYGYSVTVDRQSLENSLYTKILLNDTTVLFNSTVSALIDAKSALFRSVYYPIYNSASESFLEALLDNLILELSNCVVYFSLLKFSSVYSFRQILYKSKFLSLRNLERFKNNLNWQLYTKSYIQRPNDLYNNRYEIYILKTTGIYCRVIYANRSQDLTSLSNLPLVVIIFIELKDFITSRFDEAIFLFSKSLRFTLTNVIGQVIGLIWRGIIEGLKK